MEGYITSVLSLLEERMKKLDMGGGRGEVPNNMEYYTPPPYPTALEKKWHGQIQEGVELVEVISAYAGG